VEEAFTFWGTPEGDLVHPAECMQQLLEKVRRHRVNVDGNVCTVLVTTLVLEVISYFFLPYQLLYDMPVMNEEVLQVLHIYDQ
jgi:hypothetical protein